MNKKIIISAVLLLFFKFSYGQITSHSNRDGDKNHFDSAKLSYDFEKNVFVNNEVITLKRDKVERDVPWFVERFKIAAGFYEALNNTNISLGNSSGSIGTGVDFESDLGFSKYSPTFLAGIDWRSTSRSKFTLNYYNLHRNANYRLQKLINFGDNTYEIDAKVNSYFNTSIFRFSYGYALISKPDYELGLSIGTHIVGAKAGISLADSNISIKTSDDFGFTAPLPDFGIWGGYAFSNRFAFYGEFNYFALKINDIKGTILGFDGAFTYKVLENLDLSSGLTGFNFKVDAIKDHLNGDFKWGNNGIFFKVSYSFGKNKWH